VRLEKDTFEIFLNYLREHGYPESSFGIEYRIGKFRADLVILDPESGLPISLFEVKSTHAKQDMALARQQIASYLEGLPDSSIPTYLVFPSDQPPYFDVLRIVLGIGDGILIEESIDPSEQLDFKRQRRARIAEKTQDVGKEKNNTIERFRSKCWWSAGILFAIGILNKTCIINLSTIDMTILGACVGLVILPYASKLKILGVEFERLERARRE